MKLCRVLCIALLLLACACGRPTSSPSDTYFAANEVLDSAALLPGPPMEDSIQFSYDKMQYDEGLRMRLSPRGEVASSDADLKKIHEVFSEAFGYPITVEGTPALYALIMRVGRECQRATQSAKRKYSRIRPYVMYNTNTCFRDDEDVVRKNGSYPSGHSSNGWGLALVLAEINPARRDVILKRGYEYGQSRVICGYHWQSDVDAARMIASACVAMLHANPRFVEDLDKAKAEFAKVRF